jgi:hypothetical protein
LAVGQYSDQLGQEAGRESLAADVQFDLSLHLRYLLRVFCLIAR